MNIKDFERYIKTDILKRARKYYKDKKIISLEQGQNGFFTAKVDGTHTYDVSLRINNKGEISDIVCSCPYEHGGYCKHITAVLLSISSKYDQLYSGNSSSEIKKLINQYKRISEYAVETDIPEEEKVHIIPELRVLSNNNLYYSLKIGRTKMYVISDILKLKNFFKYNYSHKYGKDLDFVHSYNAIDEKSHKLLNLTYTFYYSQTDYYIYSSKKDIILKEDKIDDFFALYKDEYISFEDRQFLVKYENPSIVFTLKEETNERYSLKADNSLKCYGMGKRGCFINRQNNTIYLATPKFSQATSELLTVCQNKSKLYIAKKDMPTFYTSVLKPFSKYAKVKNIELLEDLIPPEAVSRLSIDLNENNEVCAKLEYIYGEEKYPIFYNQSKNPICDPISEKISKNAVMRYFSMNYDNADNPLIISDEMEIYEFLVAGISELSKIMEVYRSESFNKMKLRPSMKAKIGVRPQSASMLELEITAEDYTMEELVAMLSAYRKGKKYHRLKDGSFAFIDSSFEEFAEFTENLNLTDKTLLKEKIKIPKYRMLYLDNLKKSSENLRIKRSQDFKEIIRNYNTAIEDSEISEVPEHLDNIMREYQKYGFRWMKTISAYGFGGILADDMGLGKTIQAIALMLDAKKNSQEHRTNLVVCPSSLMLNWENEVQKFAPELKTLIISGTATVRNELFTHINEYDLIVTSYSLIARDIVKYEDIKFHLQFIDEAQYIKNHSTQTSKAVKGINAELRFALTGTPVENSLAELWSIFDFIMPDYLFGYTYFKKNFESPIVSKKSEKSVKALQKLVSPFILRRLKKEVLTELPEKTETILHAKMENEQSKLYSANVAQIKQSLQNEFGNSKERIKILAMLTRLRQVCCDPSLVYENYNGTSAKLEQCIELIENCVNSGHKILLFSQFTSMLDIISEKLESMDISYYKLTGKTKPAERIKLVNSFNEDDTKVFLISLKAGGTGLNLTGADIVIHYDPWWNISAENQASDRAYRIGQKNNVQIYKLITKNTIEENICRLQQSKAELYDIAVNGEGDIMRMSAEDILSILE